MDAKDFDTVGSLRLVFSIFSTSHHGTATESEIAYYARECAKYPRNEFNEAYRALAEICSDLNDFEVFTPKRVDGVRGILDGAFSENIDRLDEMLVEEGYKSTKGLRCVEERRREQ